MINRGRREDWIEGMGVFAKVVAKRSFFGAAQEPHGAPGPTQGRIAEMVTPTIASFGTVGMSPLGSAPRRRESLVEEESTQKLVD